MKNRATAIKLRLGALALAAGLAAQTAMPDVTIRVSQVEICWPALSNELYQVQYRSELTTNFWTDLGPPVLGNGGTSCVTDAIGDQPRKFYRVVGPPPEGMALIPAGTFTMGNTFNEGWIDELPLHTVYVSAFYMDKYAVTKALWDDVYNWAITNGYSFVYGAQGKATNHPAHSMTWYDAVKWCNARSEKENWTPAYYTEAGLGVRYRSGQVNVQTNWVSWSSGYRLPTEAEWEKAARGGASGHRFPWSDADTINWSRANYYAAPSGYSYDVNPTRGFNPAGTNGGTPFTSPVGYFAANGYGLYDMTGNVWEWSWDWYGSYSSGSQTDPRGPTSGSVRVYRGGSWYNPAYYCRTAYRGSNSPAGRTDGGGFRAVLPPGQ